MAREDQASLHGATIGTIVRHEDMSTRAVELVSMSALHLTRVLPFRGRTAGQNTPADTEGSRPLQIHVI